MTTAVRAAGSFCVILHDVTPVFASEVNSILEQLAPVVGESLAGAVVPCWHGNHPDAAGRRLLRKWSTLFGDVLCHGLTHRRERRPGVISWATG
ncbi:MAG: hypothetical protein ACKV0T_09390, partial [Planctomycetales bacterium]